MKITISDIFEKEAIVYTKISKSYSSNRYDFYKGGLDNYVLFDNHLKNVNLLFSNLQKYV
jgi:hypothetical protein